MAEHFDAKTYVPDKTFSALSGTMMMYRLDLSHFEKLLSTSELADISAKAQALAAERGGPARPGLSASPDEASWWRWLVLDACVAKYGSGGAVLEAIGNN